MPKRKTPAAEDNATNTPAKLSHSALQTLSESAVDRALASVSAAEPPAFVGINKRGQVVVGRDRDAVDAESELFLWHPLSAEAGFICWKDGSPVDERMASVFADPINPETLPDHGPHDQGDGWREQVKITGDRLSTGQRVVFSPTSYGGRKTVGAMQKQALLAMKEQGRKDLVVIASWHLGSYDHSKYGEVLTADIQVEAIMPEAEAAGKALELLNNGKAA